MHYFLPWCDSSHMHDGGGEGEECEVLIRGENESKSCLPIPKPVTCVTAESQYCQDVREFLTQFNQCPPVWERYKACKNSVGERLMGLPTGRAQRGIPRDSR